MRARDIHIEEFTVVGLIDEVVATSRLLIENKRNAFRLYDQPSLRSMRLDLLKIRQCSP